MCRTYNTIGSLKTLKSHLYNSNIHDFKSLKNVIDFQSSYTSIRQQLISHHENLIEEEKKKLKIDLHELESTIQIQKQEAEQRLMKDRDELKEQMCISLNSVPTNFLKKFITNLKQRNYTRKIKKKEDNFEADVTKAISEFVGNYNFINNRYHFIASHFNEAVKQSVQHSLAELERKKAKIDELNSFIYGAIGEHKVVKELEALSDDYFLINDFNISFSSAIYNRQENDYIKSVQIDHILIGSSGIYLIETKNWSEKSLNNLSLRSPVKQIKRTSFALFKLLNNEMSEYYLNLDRHHWGDKKISIRNLIVLTNTKPKEEFQFVKVLTLTELLRYVNYFKPIFSNTEAERIAELVLRINEQKIIETK